MHQRQYGAMNGKAQQQGEYAVDSKKDAQRRGVGALGGGKRKASVRSLP